MFYWWLDCVVHSDFCCTDCVSFEALRNVYYYKDKRQLAIAAPLLWSDHRATYRAVLWSFLFFSSLLIVCWRKLSEWNNPPTQSWLMLRCPLDQVRVKIKPLLKQPTTVHTVGYVRFYLPMPDFMGLCWEKYGVWEIYVFISLASLPFYEHSCVKEPYSSMVTAPCDNEAEGKLDA